MSNKNFNASSDEFAMALGLFVRRMRSETPSETRELSFSQLSVILRLEKEGPTTTAELARAEGVKPQSMGATVASLEQIGLVERGAHPTDGRQMIIAITARGIAIRKSAREAKHVWMAQMIGRLNKRDQAKLFEAGEIIKRMVTL